MLPSICPIKKILGGGQQKEQRDYKTAIMQLTQLYGDFSKQFKDLFLGSLVLAEGRGNDFTSSILSIPVSF